MAEPEPKPFDGNITDVHVVPAPTPTEAGPRVRIEVRERFSSQPSTADLAEGMSEILSEIKSVRLTTDDVARRTKRLEGNDTILSQNQDKLQREVRKLAKSDLQQEARIVRTERGLTSWRAFMIAATAGIVALWKEAVAFYHEIIHR